MSWLRSALSKAADKAAEVGSKNNLSKTVRAVYHGGAKMVHDRLAGRSLNNFRDAVKRIDEVSLNARGVERVLALTRWLAALKELERERKWGADPVSPKISESEDGSTSPRKHYAALFYDFENGGEALNFRDVFLRSNALEHIVTSLILEPLQEEEIGLLQEIFGLCLNGGEELHKAFISSIQDLGKAFANLLDEYEIRKGDFLEMAQAVVKGLKLNTEIERLDSEVCYLQQRIAEKQGMIVSTETLSSSEPRLTQEVLEYGSRIRNCLYRKEELLRTGDTAERRTGKVLKLKKAVDSLTESVKGLEARVAENRQQKDKAITYRDTKGLEVLEVEKALAAEIDTLTKRKEELEAELKEVNAALSAATLRHKNTQEEKEQFDDASNNILSHLFLQEKDMTRTISGQKAEASAAETWAGFLDDTWLLQSSCVEQKAQEIKDDLKEAKKQFFSFASTNLSYYQEELKLLFKQLKCFSDQLDKSLTLEDSNESQKKFELKYLEAEEQIVDLLKVADSLAEEVKSFGLEADGDDVEKKIAKSLEAIAAFREEHKTVKRPTIVSAEAPPIGGGT